MFADDFAGGVGGAEPDGAGDEHEEGGGVDAFLGLVFDELADGVVIAEAGEAEDNTNKEGDDGGLEEEDGGAGGVLASDVEGAAGEGPPLAESELAGGALFGAAADGDLAVVVAAARDVIAEVFGF